MSFIPRLFLSILSMDSDVVRLEGTLNKYLVTVLRLRDGDRFLAFDARGNEYELILQKADSKLTNAKIVQKKTGKELDAGFSLALAQSLPKGSKMDLILRQCTEAGVDRFIPFLADRSISRPDPYGAEHKSERWKKILIEACRQSGRNKVPVLDPVSNWEQVLDLFGDFDRVLMPYEKDAPSLKTALESAVSWKKILILIGPEGGWSEREILGAEEKGAFPVHLPTPILRTETAGIVTASMIRFFLKN